jgi:hypothetical protein
MCQDDTAVVIGQCSFSDSSTVLLFSWDMIREMIQSGKTFPVEWAGSLVSLELEPLQWASTATVDWASTVFDDALPLRHGQKKSVPRV